MKRQRDETITMFNKRFHNLYYKMPKEIQPTEAVAKLCYATTFHPDLSFLLMERRLVTLQQMFSDAQEVEDNFEAYGKLLDQIGIEELNSEKQESEHKREGVDSHLDPCHHEHEVNYFMNAFEECHESEAVN